MKFNLFLYEKTKAIVINIGYIWAICLSAIVQRTTDNINNNLQDYKKIIPCGLDNKKVTSLKDLGIFKIKNVNKNLEKIFLKNLFKI